MPLLCACAAGGGWAERGGGKGQYERWSRNGARRRSTDLKGSISTGDLLDQNHDKNMFLELYVHVQDFYSNGWVGLL